MAEEGHIPALRRALEQDSEILRRRRTELIALRAVLGDQRNTPLHEREIYLVGSIKRIEEQIVVVKRAIDAGS